jgi:hypothetical protein
MAGSKLNTYGVGDVNLTNIMQVLDACRIGFHAVSLTEWATTTAPKIAAGSKIEVNGAIYKFDADETITGSPSNGTVYIKLIPSGDSITAQFTNTAPIWDDEKQGWYSSTPGEGNYRYLNFIMSKNGSSYSPKGKLAKYLNNVFGFCVDGRPIYRKILNIGDWNMDSTASVNVAHGLNLSNIRSVNVLIVDDGNTKIMPLNYYYIAGSSTSGTWLITATDVGLGRVTGGDFDNNAFDATSYNRGWIIIDYV